MEKNSKKVLLIEYNVSTVRIDVDEMAAYGYILECVYNCGTALAKLRNGSHYPIVLIDIDLHDLMFWELMTFLNKQKKSTRAVALTMNFISLLMMKLCVQMGIVTIIQKPVSADYLSELLQESGEKGERCGWEHIFPEMV